MKKVLPLLACALISPNIFANTCAQQIKIREIHLTEQRIEVETKKEGVTFGKIMDCLHVNSERLGDLKFKKPSKEEAAVSFGKGQQITISRGEYEPFFWTASYQHSAESLTGNGVNLMQIAHHLTLTRKNRLGRSLFLDLTGGIVVTRAHLISPDSQNDAANDLAAAGGLRLWFQLPRSNEIYMATDFDRFYTFDNNGDKFVYRGHLKLGWEGQVATGFSLGAFAGVNSLVENGGLAEEFGGMMKFTYYNFSFSYRPMYERIETEDSELKGFRHTLALRLEF